VKLDKDTVDKKFISPLKIYPGINNSFRAVININNDINKI
jgi:hypothetical protein